MGIEEPEYLKAREEVRIALKSDNVEHITWNSKSEYAIIIDLRKGEPLKYKLDIAKKIINFIEKKRYTGDEMPEVIDNYLT